MSQLVRAAVFEAPGQPLAMRAFPRPTLAAGELLVKVVCTTLCGSDLHTYLGRRQTPCPTILGHEILGRIEELPSGETPVDLAGRPLAIGDRVTWSIAASCSECFYCRHGLPQKCERLFKYGHERIEPEHSLSGGLAEYCHLAPGTALMQVPDALPDAVACPANCATATIAAALRVAGDCQGQTILIQGAGMLGLTAAAMASAGGAREIIVCDPDEHRLASAATFGATRAVHVAGGDEEPAKTVLECTADRGADVALELSGAPAAIEAGLECLRIGGRYVLVGAVYPARDVALPAEKVVRRLLRLEGVHNYTPADLRTAVDFLATAIARYPFDELVAAQYTLDEAERAFEHAITHRAFRVAVIP